MANDLAKLVVRLEAQTAQYDASLRRATSELRRFRQNTDRSLGGISSSVQKFRQTVTTGMRGLFAGLAVGELVSFSRKIAESADQVKLLTTRVQQFSGSSSAFGRVFSAAQQLGVGLQDAADGMTRLLVVGRELGMTDKSAQRLYTTFTQLARLGGSTGAEASGAFIQLTQALGQGALRGQELNSILAGAPLVAQAIAKELNVSVGALKKLGEEGKITADIVLKALSAAAQQANDDFSKLPETLQMQQSRLENAWTTALAAMDKTLKSSEVWQFFTRKLTEALENYSGARMDVGQLTDGQLTAEERRLKDEIMRQQGFVSAARQERKVMGGVDYGRVDEQIAKLRELEARLNAVRIEASARLAPEKSMVAGLGEDAKLSTQELKELEKYLDQTRKMAEDAGRALSAIGGGSEYQNTLAINAGLAEKNLRPLEVKVAEIKEDMGYLEEFGAEAARNIQSSFADFLFDPFKDGLKGMLRGFIDIIRRMVAEMAAQMALKQMFSALSNVGGGLGEFFGSMASSYGGARAKGGPVGMGKTYLVGEKGPELFVPGSSGRIVPGGGGGATINASYNIDARGATQELIKSLPAILEENNRRLMENFRDAKTRGALA